jgi:succinate dehydrogenase / fumarate reductase cytochrome b subunit
MSQSKRPVFLNLLRIRQPVTAVLSILHRLSGLIMVLAIPLLIYLLALSLESPEGYEQVSAVLSNPYMRILEVLLTWSLAHHLLAGIRFLLLDLDVGVQIRSARSSAWVVNFLGLGLALVFLGSLL